LVQVAEWKLKCEAIEKREAERREADAKKHKEEVAFLENHGKTCQRVYSSVASKAADNNAEAANNNQFEHQLQAMALCQCKSCLRTAGCTSVRLRMPVVCYAAKQLKQQLETFFAPKK